MQVIIIISDSRSVQVMKLTSYYWFGSYEPKKKAFSRLTACLGGFSSVTAVMQNKGGRNCELAKLYYNNGLM